MPIDPGTWFTSIICNLLRIVIWPVFFGISIIMLIWAGILFLTAQGDPGKISTAKKAVLWAVIGIVVAILAFSAVGILNNVIGGSTGNLDCSAPRAAPP
jgi:hypothetical protein